MSLFGLTSLGPQSHLKDSARPSVSFEFHDISPERYMECFEKYLLRDSPTALTLEVDGDSSILRASLGDMCRELLGRQPRKHELEAWFTHCDFDRSPVMSRTEFIKAVQGLIEFSATPLQPKQYTSYRQYHTDWVKHTRLEYDKQKACNTPQTDGQQYGWHTLKPGPRDKSFPVNSTDVTINEGRTAASYYGHYVLQ